MAKLYHELQVGTNIYKLRISARACAELERKLGGSVLRLVMRQAIAAQQAETDEDAMAVVNAMISPEEYALIVHAALQKFEHGKTLDDAFDLIDDFISEGHTYMELLKEIMEILNVSGIMPKQVKQEEQE